MTIFTGKDPVARAEANLKTLEKKAAELAERLTEARSGLTSAVSAVTEAALSGVDDTGLSLRQLKAEDAVRVLEIQAKAADAAVTSACEDLQKAREEAELVSLEKTFNAALHTGQEARETIRRAMHDLVTATSKYADAFQAACRAEDGLKRKTGRRPSMGLIRPNYVLQAEAEKETDLFTSGFQELAETKIPFVWPA